MNGRRRTIAIGGSLLAHLVMAWAIMPHAPRPQIEAVAMSAALFDGDAFAVALPSPSSVAPQPERAPEPTKPPTDVEPLPVSDTLPPVDPTAEAQEIGEAVSVQVAASAAAAMAASEGERCAVGEWLAMALQNDPSIQAALDGVPLSARSVANAVMLWNGEWATPPASAVRGMTSIRALVVAGVSAAPAACQVQPISGPVLITVGDTADTTVLAIGSGLWRWQDLLQSKQQLQ